MLTDNSIFFFLASAYGQRSGLGPLNMVAPTSEVEAETTMNR